jgi:transposase
MMTPREAELTEQLRQKDEQIARLTAHVALLEQKVDLLVRRIFGARSEKLNAAQLELLLLQEDAVGKAPASAAVADCWEAEPKRSAQHRDRERAPRLPENLPVVEQVIDPDAVKACPQAWRCIGEEVSEQLDYQPAQFLRRRLIRRKYVKRTQSHLPPLIAPLPPSLQERCIAAPGLLAHIIVSKYCDHLPLYRQEHIFAQRHGVHLPRQTMVRWVELVAGWLRPIYQQMRTGVMAGGYVQVDETPVDYLSPGQGRTRQGYLWTCSKPAGDVIFEWHTSRAAACLDRIIPVDFSGTLQCDAYSGYRSFARSAGQRITLAGCWAHVRRKFHEAKDQSPLQVGWILRQMAHLYGIEARLRQQQVGPRLRQAVRAAQSRPIIRRLHDALLGFKTSRRHLPQSLIGRAIDYTLNNWPMLGVYLEDGRVEIDNNLVENAIRPTALGKKNWLFVGEADAGQRSAIIYSIIESCRRRGIDPHAYLRDVLTRLPRMTNRQIKDITPEAWGRGENIEALKAAA